MTASPTFRQLLGGVELGVAEFGIGNAVRVVLAVTIGGELHDHERQVAVEPLPPVLDHGREERAVLVGPAGVRFALIPDRALDLELQERVDHRVVERGRRERANGFLPTSARFAAGSA